MLLASSLWLAACSVVGDRSGTEEPRFTVVARVGEVEIREYAPRLAAEVTVEGDEEAARSAGFRTLAAYIFGKNRTSQSIAMTAPVAQAADAGASIAMTAPVAAQAAGQGKWTIRFFMPAEYNAQTLPAPLDPAIRIVTVPGETMAVRRFSGDRSPEAVARERAALLDALRTSGGWVASGEPVDWFYDPPWTLPAMRRNEVAVPVRRAGG